MDLISGVFFSCFYLFSIGSICWWIYLAYAHDGVGAYLHLSEHRSSAFLNRSVISALKKHFELISILVCFLIFLFALCDGFSYYFSWIPDQYRLTLGDGSTLALSTILSCLVGISSSLIFGKWIFTGICSYWEKRALAQQSNLYFDIIRHADDVEELGRIKAQTLETIKQLKENGRFVPDIVCSRLELCVQIIELRTEDIKSAEDKFKTI